MALDLGWSDPLALLCLEPRLFQVSAAIIADAQDLRNKRVKAELDYLAAKSASGVTGPLGRHITNLVKALARR